MIVGWRSPLDGKLYELDDYAGMGQVVPEPVLRAMADKARLDTRHQGPNITITSGLSCPRKTVISRGLPTTPDPTKMWKLQRGTWLHEMVGLTLGQNPDWWTEEIAEDKCVYEGTLFGVEMSCKIDAIKRDYSELLDWKFRGDGAERWIDPMGRAKDEDAAQLNMARMLIEQQTGRDLSNMSMHVWVMAGKMVKTTVPLMNEEQVGAIRPGGGDYTISMIFRLLAAAMNEWRTLGDEVAKRDLERIIAAMPMVGEKMYQNKRTPSLNMCTQYCEVQDMCYACNGEI